MRHPRLEGARTRIADILAFLVSRCAQLHPALDHTQQQRLARRIAPHIDGSSRIPIARALLRSRDTDTDVMAGIEVNPRTIAVSAVSDDRGI